MGNILVDLRKGFYNRLGSEEKWKMFYYDGNRFGIPYDTNLINIKNKESRFWKKRKIGSRESLGKEQSALLRIISRHNKTGRGGNIWVMGGDDPILSYEGYLDSLERYLGQGLVVNFVADIDEYNKTNIINFLKRIGEYDSFNHFPLDDKLRRKIKGKRSEKKRFVFNRRIYPDLKVNFRADDFEATRTYKSLSFLGGMFRIRNLAHAVSELNDISSL